LAVKLARLEAEELVLVDQAVRDESRCKAGAAEADDGGAGSLLERPMRASRPISWPSG
jgi:hypothetical protein